MILFGNTHRMLLQKSGINLDKLRNQYYCCSRDEVRNFTFNNIFSFISSGNHKEKKAAKEIVSIITHRNEEPYIMLNECHTIEEFHISKGFLPTGLKILFFCFSESGAMGTGGDFTAITTNDGKALLFNGNYCCGELDWNDVTAIFPPIKQFSRTGTLPFGLKIYNYGAGNYLFVDTHYTKLFENETEADKAEILEVPYLKPALTALGCSPESINDFINKKYLED